MLCDNRPNSSKPALTQEISGTSNHDSNIGPSWPGDPSPLVEDNMSRSSRPQKWLYGFIPRRHVPPSAAVKIRQGRNAPPLTLRRFTLYGFLRLCYLSTGGGDIPLSQPLTVFWHIGFQPSSFRLSYPAMFSGFPIAPIPSAVSLHKIATRLCGF